MVDCPLRASEATLSQVWSQDGQDREAESETEVVETHTG